MKVSFILVLFLSVISACTSSDNEELKIDNEGINVLIGCWSNVEATDSLVLYNRVNSLPNNNYGIEFKDNHTVIERKNAGWCGTPPISYGDYAGTWQRKDSAIKVNVGYWGGTVEYTWKIITLDNKKLTIQLLEETYHNTTKI